MNDQTVAIYEYGRVFATLSISKTNFWLMLCMYSPFSTRV